MVEFKFTAQKLNGQTISGTLSADTVSEGKKKIIRLAEKNKLKLGAIEKKSTYLYRVRKGKDKPIHGEQKAFNKKEVEEYVYSALKKVNLDPNEIASSYPHNLSGGQRQRVSFARSLVLKPLLIIADEPVSMLDVSIRIQILELMKKLKEENVSFLYITHDLATSQYVGDNIIILYKGQIIEQGNIKQVLHHPLHPYTKALISAIPKFTDHDKEIKIKNDPEPASKLTNGCKFFNKCLYSTEECKIKEPPLTNDDTSDLRNSCSTNHFIRCFNYKVIL